MAVETGGVFEGGEEGGSDFGAGGKQGVVPEIPNGVHADATGDGESLDFSKSLEGLEGHSEGGGVAGLKASEVASSADLLVGRESDDAEINVPEMHAKANGDHISAAQDGETLEVSEDRLGSVDEVMEDSRQALQDSGAVEEEAPKAVQASPQVAEPLEAGEPSKASETVEHNNGATIEAPPAMVEGLEHTNGGAPDSEAAEYPPELAPSTARSEDEEKISSSTPEAGTVQPAESARLDTGDPKQPVEVSSSVPPNAVPTLGRNATKRGKGPTDEELKKMMVIPEYLAKDVANAIKSAGAAYPDGPPFGDKIEAPTCPIIVFVNSKSGGRLGPKLTQILSDLISPDQVFDLSSTKPTAVVSYGIGCLDKLAASGDECAQSTRSNLRIIVAGGDGTVGWVLSCLGELQISSPGCNIPPVGIIPLGTGNDLSRSFGWGEGFSSASRGAIRKLLIKTLSAYAAPLDTWQVVVKPAVTIASTDIQFPHALHPQHHIPLPKTVSGKNDQKDETDPCFEGLFWNYFSVGMDAQIAYGFHHLRDVKPWLARGRVTNQMIYSGYGCTQGWFCTSCSAAPRARGIHNIVRLEVKRPGNSAHDWEEIEIPHNIRAIVILNLQSYAGGRKPWGHPSEDTMKKEGFVEAKSDDGLLEIVGFRDGWHTAFIMISVLTAVRLCQAEAVRLKLQGNRPRGYMQMDGEPWKQPLGRVDEPATLVEIHKLSTPSTLLKR